MTTFDYGQLDPGIRETVRLLHRFDYDTVDSGDGVSKPADERVFHEPHVIVRIPSNDIAGQSERLAVVLGPEWYVEASYSTIDKSALATCLRHEARERAIRRLLEQGVIAEADRL